MRKRDAIAWAALCAAPLIALAVALSVKYEMLPAAPLLAAVNVMLAVFYWKADALFKAGLMHGVGSPEDGRKVLWAAGIITAVMNTGIALALACSASSPG